jgi:nitroreductase
MALLLALEYKGLAACPLNAMLSVAREKSIRSLVSFPESESIIMFLAVGNFKPEIKVPKSFRYSAKDIATGL